MAFTYDGRMMVVVLLLLLLLMMMTRYDRLVGVMLLHRQAACDEK